MKTVKYIALVLLFVGGLVHLLPGTLTPFVDFGYGVVTVQRIVGLLSVVVATYLFFAPEK